MVGVKRANFGPILERYGKRRGSWVIRGFNLKGVSGVRVEMVTFGLVLKELGEGGTDPVNMG